MSEQNISDQEKAKAEYDEFIAVNYKLGGMLPQGRDEVKWRRAALLQYRIDKLAKYTSQYEHAISSCEVPIQCLDAVNLIIQTANDSIAIYETELFDEFIEIWGYLF